MERRDLVRLTLLIVVLLAVSGLIGLASTGSDDGGGGPSRGETLGVITTVTQDRLVLDPADGGPAQTFAIRDVDARRLDLFHLRQHSAQRLPTRVLWLDDRGTRYAVDAIDAVPAG